jgi:ankyrin repeat protein
MSQKPPVRAMRENPDLDQLKRQARELLEAYRASSPDAIAEVTAWYHSASPETFALHDAQLVLARSYGFESWPKLKAAVDGVTAAGLHEAVASGDLKIVRGLLTRRPEIIGGRALQTAVLRRDLEMTRLLLEFGADPHSGQDPATPAIIARDRGYDEIVEAIRAAHEKRGGRRPTLPPEAMAKIHRAQQSGSEEAMVAVLEDHPEVAGMMRAPDGVTGLHQAAGRGALLIMKWLLDHGADVNARAQSTPTYCAAWVPESRQDWTPLDFAATGWGGQWLFDNPKFQRAAKLLLEHGAQLTRLSAASLGRWEYLEKFPKQDLEGKGMLEAAVRGDQPDVLRRLLDLGLDPDEPVLVPEMYAARTWSAGGPLFQAVVLNRIEMARLLLERGAGPNATVFTAGSAASRGYNSQNAEMIALIEQYGGWLDPGSAGYARQTGIARRMLAGEIDSHLEPNDWAGHTVAEQLLWGGASSFSVEIVRMALEHIDWAADHPRWFGMLLRPLQHYEAQRETECCECFKLILDRCGPHHLASDYGQSMLHQAVAGGYVKLATILLDAGARFDGRDKLLMSTPLGWACRWGRVEFVELFLARGADPLENDAEAWATPRAWAEKGRHDEVLALLKGRA